MEREWLTVAEAAKSLVLTTGSVSEAIARGRLKAEKVSPRLLAILPEELERYRREQRGKRGWDKRKAEGHTPSRKALYMREYRAHKQARQEANAENGAGGQDHDC
jgi:hypothetical protein